MDQKQILVTPLNWGLGHATRCIPIIRMLLQAGHKVHLGSDGVALGLIRKEFPDLPYLELKGYGVHYKGRILLFSLFLQLPTILYAIIAEHRQVNKYIRDNHIDTILSDNRFGCRSRRTFNIFMTHQLKVIIGFKPLQLLATLCNKFLISRFDECWIPDHEPPHHLAGPMIDLKDLKNIRFLGPISRFTPLKGDIIRDFIAVLSGPEPARSLFEQQLIEQAADLPYTFLLVRGLPNLAQPIEKLPSNIQQVPYMTSEDLNKTICESRFVISRTGYTTLMDLNVLQKQAILVPTPGQPEQEYLGDALKDSAQFVTCRQQEFILKEMIAQLFAKQFIPEKNLPNEGLKRVFQASKHFSISNA